MKWFCIIFLFLISLASQAQVRKVCDLPSMPEISGMAMIQDEIWTLNDGGNTAHLYRIDSFGNAIDSTSFLNASNNDWEELSCNSTHVFIGDFGNNNGTRKNLRIFTFPISELGNQTVIVDTISFYYPSQSDFSSNPFTIYDCEAMLALDDSIILFSKSYADAICRIYSLPASKGDYPARWCDSLELDFWVTGAMVSGDNVALCGYGFNGNLVPKMASVLLGSSGFYRPSLASRSLPLTHSNQVESVLQTPNKKIWLACETSNGYAASIYETDLASASYSFPFRVDFMIKPNPANKWIRIYNNTGLEGELKIVDSAGKIQRKVTFSGKEYDLDISALVPGNYFLHFTAPKGARWVEKISVY